MHLYFDYNASSPLAPEVVEAIRPFLTEAFGNPSSLHWAGRPARSAIEDARGQVAALLGASPTEIRFTSGGTEANNWVVKGVHAAHARRGEAVHVVTSAIEHPAVTEPLRFLREVHGVAFTEVPVDAHGRVDPSDVAAAIRPETRLVTIMHANNEVGTLQPVPAVSRVCRERGVLLHTDAAQSVGKVPVDVDALGVDLLTVAGHKLLAPKGVGALYVRRGTALEPLLHGAGHEGGQRSGTENTPWIVGLGVACRLAREHLADGGAERTRRQRDRLEAGIREIWNGDVVVQGHPTERLPNTCAASFVGLIGKDLLESLEGVAASTGAACHSGVVELSRVLRAMGVSERVGMGTIRFSVGRYTTDEEVQALLDALRRARLAQ